MILPKIKQPIFILGMHRSGTTMITRALADAGVHIGTVCDHNSEALYAIDINERIFQSAGVLGGSARQRGDSAGHRDFETNLQILIFMVLISSILVVADGHSLLLIIGLGQ